MTRTVRQIVTMAAVLAGLAGAPVQAAGEVDLDGTYLSEGVNPDGSKYRGVVTISRNGDSFTVSWLTPRAEKDRVLLQRASVGVGILSRDMLSVSYYAPKASGIVVYQIEEQGQRLAGRWAVAGESGAVHSEILTRLPDSAEIPAIEPEAPPVNQTPAGPPGTRIS